MNAAEAAKSPFRSGEGPSDLVYVPGLAGMHAGLVSASTVERLQAAEAAGTLESADARTLMEAFGLIFSLRLDHQLEQWG